MKKSLKLLALFFALVMLLGTVACGYTGDGETTTDVIASGDTGEVTTDNNGKDENGYELDDLPEKMDFKKAEIKILNWIPERVEFEVTEDELDGSIVEEALYSRNVNTEARMNVTFSWTEQEGNSANRANFTDFVQRAYNDGTSFDIIATYSRTAGMLMQRGLFTDLNTIDNNYLNYKKPWWPDPLLDTCTIGDSLYCISGDISTNVLHFMYAIYYNVDMLNDLTGYEDPVTLVDNKTWTISKLIEMSSNLYKDNDSTGKLSEADSYGFGTIYYHVDAFYTGSNLTLVNTDDDELLVISPDYASQKAVDLIDKLGKWLTTNDCYVSRDGASVSYQNPFVQQRMLFCQNRVYMADNRNGCGLNAVDWSYGLVPTPLYDENQDNYITMVGNPFTLWGIMSGVKDEDCSRATAIMECMASLAFRKVTPALFETNMKYRYTNSSEDKFARMFDILHNTLKFDLGRIFSDDLAFMSEIPSKCATTGGSWKVQAAGQTKVLGIKCKDLAAALREHMDD